MSLGARLLENLPRRPLVLHFDLNRTIIQVDLAGGKTLKDILNNNLASCVTGVCDPAKTPLTWQAITDPDGRKLPQVPAEQINSIPEAHRMTYDEFVDEVVAPKPKEMDTLPKDEALALWSTVTAKRRALKNTFCDAGQPGQQFYEPFYTDMHKRMLKNPEDFQSNSSNNNSNAPTHFVIPAFFAVVETLWELKWPFRVVFRTFGRELKEVLHDVEKGLAERAPGLWAYVVRNTAATATTGTNNPLAWCPVSALYRDSKVGAVLCHNVDFSPKSLDEWTQKGHSFSATNLEELFAEFTGLNAANPAASSEGKSTEKKDNNNVNQPVSFRGFVDHYPWWAANGELDTAGKMFPVRVTPFVDDNDPIQVFFDDNIYCGDPHSIVDLRNVVTHEHVTDVEVQKAFLVRAEPRYAILDEFYYVRRFAEAAEKQVKLRGKKVQQQQQQAGATADAEDEL